MRTEFYDKPRPIDPGNAFPSWVNKTARLTLVIATLTTASEFCNAIDYKMKGHSRQEMEAVYERMLAEYPPPLRAIRKAFIKVTTPIRAVAYGSLED